MWDTEKPPGTRASFTPTSDAPVPGSDRDPYTLLPMSVFAVEYVYAAGSDAIRDEHRPGHRGFLSGLAGDFALVASGPYVDGSGALLLISAPSQASLAETLKNDPFAINGAIAALRITEWSPVTGELAHHA